MKIRNIVTAATLGAALIASVGCADTNSRIQNRAGNLFDYEGYNNDYDYGYGYDYDYGYGYNGYNYDGTTYNYGGVDGPYYNYGYYGGSIMNDGISAIPRIGSRYNYNTNLTNRTTSTDVNGDVIA